MPSNSNSEDKRGDADARSRSLFSFVTPNVFAGAFAASSLLMFRSAFRQMNQDTQVADAVAVRLHKDMPEVPKVALIFGKKAFFIGTKMCVAGGMLFVGYVTWHWQLEKVFVSQSYCRIAEPFL